MKKTIMGAACGIFSFFSLANAYAANGELPTEPFNPPPTIEAMQAGKAAFFISDKKHTLEKLQHYQQQSQQVTLDLHIAIEDCVESHAAKKTAARAPLTACTNQAITTIFQQADYPYMDLIQSMNDKRLQFSQSVDNGSITQAQAQAELNQFSTTMINEERKRNEGIENSAQVLSSN